MREYQVYILASRSGVLYIGVTNDLSRQMAEHQGKSVPGFTSKYNVNRLVYFESFDEIRDAVAREKQLKGWRREKKTELIQRANPTWGDLSMDWFDDSKKDRDPSTSSG